MTRSTQILSRLALSLLLLMTASSAARPAAADVVKTFVLSHVTFSDGSSAVGSLTYDFTTQTLVSVSVTAGGVVYDNSDAAPVSVTTSSFSGGYNSDISVNSLHLALNLPLTPTSGSAITLDPSLSTETIDTTQSSDTGTVTTLAVVSGSISPLSALPVTTVSLAGTLGKNGWYVSPVTVTLKATASMPIASTVYSLDGGLTQTYSGPFVVSTDAVHLLTFYSSDTAGDLEGVKSAGINVEISPPVTHVTVKNGVMLLYTVVDASGTTTFYTVDSGAVLTASGGTISAAVPGLHTVWVWSVDIAGHVETPKSYQIDTPPSVPGAPIVTAQTVTGVTLKWSASHSAAGVAGYTLMRYYPGHGGRYGYPSHWANVGTTTSPQITYSLPASTAFTNSVTFAVTAFDSTGHSSGMSGTTVVEVYLIPSIYPTAAYVAGARGPYGILGGGFGEIASSGATSFSAYTMTVAGYPVPTLTVISGPKGMTVSTATGVVSWVPSGAPGSYTATIQAASAAGTASTTFTYIVYPAGTDLFSPSAPVAAPTFSNITHTGATVSWAASTDNVGVAGYEIDLYDSVGAISPIIVNSAGTGTSKAVTGLPPGSNAYVRVYAYDAAGNHSDGSPYGLLSLTP